MHLVGKDVKKKLCPQGKTFFERVPDYLYRFKNPSRESAVAGMRFLHPLAAPWAGPSETSSGAPLVFQRMAIAATKPCRTAS